MNDAARNAPGSLRSKSRLRLRHTTLGLKGELDQTALAELGDRLIRLLDQSCVWVLLDFSAVEHLDYRGVPALVARADALPACRRRPSRCAAACRRPPGRAAGRRCPRNAEGFRDPSDARAAMSGPFEEASLEGERKTNGVEFAHQTVLRDEVVELLAPKAGNRIIDATLGGGGHAEALLDAGAEVIGVDRDPAALWAASARLGHRPLFRGLEGNAGDLEALLAPLGLLPVDGVFMTWASAATSSTTQRAASPFRPTARWT